MQRGSLKIGLVAADFFPNVGGIAAHVYELGKALAQMGHEVHVFTVPLLHTKAGDELLDGMHVHRLATPLLKPIYSWTTHRALQAAIPRYGLDVLHVHGIRPLEATQGLDIPVVFTNHSSGFLKRVAAGPRQRKRIGRRLEHICHVLAPSQELADRTADVGFAGPIDFISNGVDTDKFHPGESTYRAQWQIPEDTPVLLLARRLVEKNGVVVFAEALTRLKSHRWSAVFAGDGDQRGPIETILKQHDLLDRCRMLGNVPSWEMPQLYRGADISVLPSFMEATSITGLESMATALPLVGTRVGGIPTLIDEGHSGLLVPCGDPAALATAIAKLLEDDPLRQSMGQVGRERAERQFSWKSIAGLTADIFQQHLPTRKMAA